MHAESEPSDDALKYLRAGTGKSFTSTPQSPALVSADTP